mmetsp:Transcript_7683/g.6872  ORF Transcript_7683/g.6872 Transcript_7683/m.6872 type:complete len:216 (+) Transcript_7683:64-711(+)
MAEEMNSWFKNIENDENNLLLTGCNGCMFAIKEVKLLRANIEKKFSYMNKEISSLKENYRKLLKNNIKIRNELSEIKDNITIDKIIREGEMLIYDTMDIIYDKIWNHIKLSTPNEYFSKILFFEEVNDLRSPNHHKYGILLMNAISSIGMSKEDYESIVNFKFTCNSHCHYYDYKEDKKQLQLNLSKHQSFKTNNSKIINQQRIISIITNSNALN